MADPNLMHDWKVWNNRETVVVRSRRTVDGVTDWAVHSVSAKRRALQFRDLAASGGVYTPQDLKWCVPAELIAPLGDLKPGDIIEPADGAQWVMMPDGVSLNTWKSWWGCVCRNLVVAHDLRELIDVWAPTNAQDAQGNRAPTFTALHSKIPGRIQPIDGTVEESLGKRAITKRYTAYLATQLTVAQNLAITNEMQLRINGTTTAYQIVAWRNPDSIDRLFEIDLEILP